MLKGITTYLNQINHILKIQDIFCKYREKTKYSYVSSTKWDAKKNIFKSFEKNSVKRNRIRTEMTWVHYTVFACEFSIEIDNKFVLNKNQWTCLSVKL